MEEQAEQDAQGRGQLVSCSRKPLLEPQSQGWKWEGEVASTLARLVVLLEMQEQKPFRTAQWQWQVIRKLVNFVESKTIECDGLDVPKLMDKLQTCSAQQQSVSEDEQPTLKKLANYEGPKWKGQRAQEHKEWLEGARNGHLKPCRGPSKHLRLLWSDHSKMHRLS